MTYQYTNADVFGTDLNHVRKFLHEKGEALAAAANRLGGRAASARVFLLCEAVHIAVRLTQPQKRQLIDLHQLLTLENVGDPDRIESALFAEIDPDSSFVGEFCLLAETLEALLRQISDDDRSVKPRTTSASPLRKVA